MSHCEAIGSRPVIARHRKSSKVANHPQLKQGREQLGAADILSGAHQLIDLSSSPFQNLVVYMLLSSGQAKSSGLLAADRQ